MSEQFSDGICGGWSPVMPVTLEVIKICLEVRHSIEERVENKTDSKIFIPLVYSSQTVAGKNYLVKVLLDGKEDGLCVHAKIYQALPCHEGKLSVTGTHFPKTFYDPLIPF
ncbi:hypothetical protein Q8A67_003013 [Cirrhinus molitorella]|uniref:Cystatin domain-containing protein n=1 Tax=Cirrhinus molitorella TaxID=172907 RepID=A0AA88PZW9_9TELE|nr:hypothetical protein Q8A67_003013 [Cirrhinus molitorella]